MSTQTKDPEIRSEPRELEEDERAKVEEILQYREPKGRYAVHGTSSRRNADPVFKLGSIAEDGLLTDKAKSKNDGDWNHLFPFDRNDVVYLTIDYDYVQYNIEDNPFGTRDFYVVVDLGEIAAEIYLADMKPISMMRELPWLPESKKKNMPSEKDFAHRYAESIQEIAGPEDIRSVPNKTIEGSEIVVDGDVPQEAMVDIITI